MLASSQLLLGAKLGNLAALLRLPLGNRGVPELLGPQEDMRLVTAANNILAVSHGYEEQSVAVVNFRYFVQEYRCVEKLPHGCPLPRSLTTERFGNVKQGEVFGNTVNALVGINSVGFRSTVVVLPTLANDNWSPLGAA